MMHVVVQVEAGDRWRAVERDGATRVGAEDHGPRDERGDSGQLVRDDDDRGAAAVQLGQQARKDALARYSLERCLPRQLELIDLVASGAIGR